MSIKESQTKFKQINMLKSLLKEKSKNKLLLLINKELNTLLTKLAIKKTKLDLESEELQKMQNQIINYKVRLNFIIFLYFLVSMKQEEEEGG